MRATKLTAPNIVLALLCLMYLILYVNRVNIATAAPLIQKELGLTNTQLGSRSRPLLTLMRCFSLLAVGSAIALGHAARFAFPY